MDILDLPGWRLLEAPLDAEGYRLAAEQARLQGRSAHTPHCTQR
jgi:hypothetical protein